MGLKELRQAAGLSLQAMAEKSGVHYVKISQIENGTIKAENMTLKNALKLSDALGCHPRDLLPSAEDS